MWKSGEGLTPMALPEPLLLRNFTVCREQVILASPPRSRRRSTGSILSRRFRKGLSGTFQSAELAINELRALYPKRSIACIDTLTASIGEGLPAREALRRQAEGYSLSELISWVHDNRLKVCHWFTVDTFDHLRHGRRVSAPAPRTPPRWPRPHSGSPRRGTWESGPYSRSQRS